MDQRRDSAIRGGIFTCSALFLGALVPMLLVEWPVTFPAGLAVAVLVLSGVRFAWLLGLGERRLMELSLWTFTYVFLGLAPLVQIQTSRWPETAPRVFLAYLEPAMWVILVGTMSALVGVLAASRRPALAKPTRPSRVIEGRVTLLGVVALAANAYLLYTIGQTSPLLSRTELREVEFAAFGDQSMTVLIVGICTMPLLVAFVALVQVNRQRRERGLRVKHGLMLVTGLAVLYSVNPISSPRYYTGTVLLAMAAALGAYATPARVRFSAVAFLAGLLLLFPLADSFRNAGPVDVEFQPLVSLTTGDFDGLVQTMNTTRYVDLKGVTWGEQAAGVALFWVPRGWWEDKPIDTGGLVAQSAGYQFTNMSAPLWAEMFINGGWVLLAVGALTFGWWVRRWDDRAVSSGAATSPLAMILPFYLVILLRGSLLQAMAYLAVLVAASWFVSDRRSHDEPLSAVTDVGRRLPLSK